MTPLFALLLGILQGLTEFLPISSSGHLWAARHLGGMHEPELAFDIAVHVATLAAILLYFRRSLGALVRGCAGRETPGQPPPADQRRLALLVALTLVPTGLVFLLFKDALEHAGEDPRTLAGAFFVTGLLLFGTRLSGNRPPKVAVWSEMPYAHALLIGLAQGAALTPGISRAGATIAVALYLRLDRELAVQFSFFMAIPAIAGAAIIPLTRGLDGIPPAAVLAGMSSAFLVGLGSIHILKRAVLGRWIHWFSLYVAVVAVIVLVGTPKHDDRIGNTWFQKGTQSPAMDGPKSPKHSELTQSGRTIHSAKMTGNQRLSPSPGRPGRGLAWILLIDLQGEPSSVDFGQPGSAHCLTPEMYAPKLRSSGKLQKFT